MFKVYIYIYIELQANNKSYLVRGHFCLFLQQKYFLFIAKRLESVLDARQRNFFRPRCMSNTSREKKVSLTQQTGYF